MAVLDTMRLSDGVGHVMASQSRSLAALCASLSITNVHAHSAAGDATATATALLDLLRIAGAHGHTNLVQLLEAAGLAPTTTIPAAIATDVIRRCIVEEQPPEHLATHLLLGSATELGRSSTHGPTLCSSAPACGATSSPTRQPSPSITPASSTPA